MKTRRSIYLMSALAIVVIAGALLVNIHLNRARAESMDAFAAEYGPADPAEREELSEQFLAHYPASQLLGAIETKVAVGVCHGEAHPLGRAVYKQNPNLNDAIKQCGNACSYGCFHGALMEMFGTNSDTLGGVIEDETPDQYLSHVRDMAHDLCTRPEVHDAVRLRYCYHGLGHVFESIQHDLPKAIGSCRMWSDVATERTCADGVFMEYLLASSSAAVLNTKGPEPCNAYPFEALECFRYKAYGWLDVWGSPHDALVGCHTFGNDTIACISAVAEAQAERTIMYSDEDIDGLCGFLSGEEKNACVTGVLLRLYNLNDGDDAQHSCDRITGKYRQQCLNYIDMYSLKTFAE